MLYKLFKKTFFNIWKEVKIQDDKNLSLQVYQGDISCKTYSYLEDANEYHLFNLIRKKAEEKSHVIFDIHGGGYAYGTKDLNKYFNYDLAKRGFTLIAPSYRLLDDKLRLQDQIQDIFACLHYLVKNKEILNLDLNSLTLTGDSAGGGLAFYVLMINNSTRLQRIYNVKKVDINFTSLILNHSTVYHTLIGKIGKNPLVNLISQTSYQRLMFGPFYHFRKTYRSVNINKQVRNPLNIPLLIISSEGDKGLNPLSKKLYADMKKNKWKCEYYFEEDEKAVHVFNVSFPDLDISKKANAKIESFIKEHM